MANAEYTEDAYNWGTLFQSNGFTVEIAEAMFISAVTNAGLHLVSLALSIFLAAIFRKISHFPPDMNPLEDNLTARPQRSRKQIDVDEKHISSSTLNSTLEDPLIGPPRSMPFTHTRGQSWGSGSNRGSVDMMNEKRQFQASVRQYRLPHMETSGPEMLFHQSASHPCDVTSRIPVPEHRNIVKQLPEFVDPTTHMRHLTSRAADRSDSVSPLSDNWVTYSDRSPSPMSDVHHQDANTLRQSSSVYSRRTDATGTSTGSGIRDWFAYGQRPAPSIGSVIPEDTRGEYTSLAMHEYYGNDDNRREQDLGDQRFNIFPDPAEHDHDNEDELPFNPLMLNPPTPKPVLTEKPENTDPVRRNALGDNPNLSYNPKAQVFLLDEDSDSPPTRDRFYGDLEGEDKLGISRPREVSGQEELTLKQTKLSTKRGKKMSAYQSLRKDDSDDEDYLSPRVPSSPPMAERDRKGRVVSNSGADTARTGLVSGVGASLTSYGSYIAGLGVGRRRDVSGKVAEEGRGSKTMEERPSPSQKSQSQGSSPIRAAGWARFAGL